MNSVVCFIERIFVVFKLDHSMLFPWETHLCACFFPNITYLYYNHNSLPAPLSCDLVLVFFFFFPQWENRTELVWYLNRLSFLLKPPALAIWLYFFFPSRKEDGQKKTYTHCWFQPQELCLQCSVALNFVVWLWI